MAERWCDDADAAEFERLWKDEVIKPLWVGNDGGGSWKSGGSWKW